MDPVSKPMAVPNNARNPIKSYTTSKKRMFADISPEEDSMGGTLFPARTPGVSPTAIYSEKMTRINPLTGTPATAETQTGTWFEDQLEKKLSIDLNGQTDSTTDSEGDLPKRKLMRWDASLDADAIMAANPTESPKATVADPPIDRYTHLLGVGWTYVGESSEFAAMARGFSRYIDNHYPLTDIEVFLKSKSLESYLVKSNQGYYLFKEDLSSGQLIARTWEETLANLQSSPVRFSWAQTLVAARTPPGQSHETVNDTETAAKAAEGGDMELD